MQGLAYKIWDNLKGVEHEFVLCGNNKTKRACKDPGPSRCFRTYAEAQKKMHELWRKGQEDAFIRIKFINREGGIASKRPMPPPPRNHN